MIVETSPIFDEIRTVGREEGRAARHPAGPEKFGKAPTKTGHKTLEAMTEVDRLEALAEPLLNVDTWADRLSDV
jgi:hypothetical protein